MGHEKKVPQETSIPEALYKVLALAPFCIRKFLQIPLCAKCENCSHTVEMSPGTAADIEIAVKLCQFAQNPIGGRLNGVVVISGSSGLSEAIAEATKSGIEVMVVKVIESGKVYDTSENAYNMGLMVGDLLTCCRMKQWSVAEREEVKAGSLPLPSEGEAVSRSEVKDLHR